MAGTYIILLGLGFEYIQRKVPEDIIKMSKRITFLGMVIVLTAFLVFAPEDLVIKFVKMITGNHPGQI